MTPGWRNIAAATALVLMAWATGPAAQPDAPAAPTDLEAVLAELTMRADSDGFEAVRPEFEALVARDDLPAVDRSRILREAITRSRAERVFDFQEPAQRAFERLAEEVPDGDERSRLTQSMAVISIDRGAFEDAERFYLEADALAVDRPIAERANLMTGLGVARAQQGNLDGALEAMLEAYARYERTEEGPSANLLRNIGGLSIYLEDFEQSVEFTRRAIEVLGPDDPTTPGAYSNLAAALVELGRPDDALEALATGIAIAERQGRPNSALLSNLGFIQLEQGRYDEALATFEQTEAINRADGDTSSLAITVKNIGDVHVARGDREQAADVYERSLALYREADIKPKRLELYEPLVENLEALGRYPEALALSREWRDLTEQLASADAQARVAELQTAFDLERSQRELAESERMRLEREAELASLQATQAALQAAQTRQRMIRGLLLAGVVALALFVAVLARSLRVRARANRLLAEKNAEIDVQRRALAATNAKLHRLSNEDELTGLGNRRSLRRLLESELPTPLTAAPRMLVLIDLDRFKQINDRFGHPVGDRVLDDFADLLREVAGPHDVLARWGGEEFLWLIADVGIEAASERCRMLAAAVRAADFDADGARIPVTCSMGAASIDLSGGDPATEFDLALKVADAALYEAKQSGRDGWRAFERVSTDRDTFSGSLDPRRLQEQGALRPIES